MAVPSQGNGRSFSCLFGSSRPGLRPGYRIQRQSSGERAADSYRFPGRRCTEMPGRRQASSGGRAFGRVVTELRKEAFRRGLSNLLVFTRPANSLFFESLGFSLIASTKEACFLESRREGLQEYLRDLTAAGAALAKACKAPGPLLFLSAKGPGKSPGRPLAPKGSKGSGRSKGSRQPGNRLYRSQLQPLYPGASLFGRTGRCPLRSPLSFYPFRGKKVFFLFGPAWLWPGPAPRTCLTF